MKQAKLWHDRERDTIVWPWLVAPFRVWYGRRTDEERREG